MPAAAILAGMCRVAEMKTELSTLLLVERIGKLIGVILTYCDANGATQRANTDDEAAGNGDKLGRR